MIRGVCWKKWEERKREVVVAKEENFSGLFIRIVVKGSGRSGMICIPELDKESGWTLVAEKDASIFWEIHW